MSGSDSAVGLLGQTTAADAGEHTDGIQRIASNNTIHAGDAIRRRTGSIVNGARDFREWSSRYLRWMCGLDAVAGMAAAVVAGLRQPALHLMINQWLLLGVIGLVAWPVSIGAARGYRRHQVSVGATELRAVLQAGGMIIIIAALPTAWFGEAGLLGSVGLAAPVAAAASIGVRVACCHYLRRRQRHGQNLRRVIMVGSTQAVQELRTVIEREPSMGMRVAGVCVPAAEMRSARALDLPVVGDVDHVAAIASELDCDAVAVTGTDAMRSDFLRQLAWSLEDTDAELLLHPGLIDVALPRMQLQSCTHAPMLHVEPPHFEGWTRRLKRAMDLMITGVGLLVISPLLAAVALVIKLDDGGPVIFRQIRIGTDGKPFLMLKFRSMCVDAEQKLAALVARNEGAGPLFKIENDPRITRVGRILRKYSLDELPQLFNVLAGSMSLVGPRPPLKSEVDEYSDPVRRRLKVLPGLTGLWQVSGRSLLSWEESVRLDLKYVENWSIGLDVAIMFRTVHAVFARRGAF